jgi:Asp-tRNA(Asn)/Glu-tRNA(Gln) amidotransferase C subunit
MQETPKEHLLELARQAVKEQDLEKILAMIEQIEQLVEQERVAGRPISH